MVIMKVVFVVFVARFFVANIVLVSFSLIVSSIIVNFWSRSSSQLEGPSTASQKVEKRSF
jgi:hypothetical protein